MRIISMFLVMCLMTLRVFADGTIAGKVNDEKTGDAIIGATIIVKGTAKGAATDVDGNFSIQVPEGTYTVEIKYIGYQAKEISEVEVLNNATVSLNATITEAKNTQLNEVVVRSSIKKENVSALYIMQKNSAVVSSGISADVIQRSPDRNTGEVLKRVSGASIKDNKYVVIRGLSDRYNLAMVNNALMPSTEPDKKAFSFDVIPSNLIDNIVITKTATPDLPGDFAGGVVQVATKDVPEEDFLNVGIGAGYNTQSTFKDITSNGRSAGDYLGFPSKENKLPSSFKDNYMAYRGMPLNDRIAAAKELPNSYKEVNSSGLPNMSLQASGGKAIKFKNGDKFGLVGGLSYRNSLNYDPTYERGRFDDGQVINQLYTDKYSKLSSSLAAIANFAYVTGKSKISFKNLYNKLYDNVSYQRTGFSLGSSQQILGSSSIPSERQIFNTQLEGDHAFGKKNMKLNWNLNYSSLTANQRDLRTGFYNRNSAFNEENYPIDNQEAYVVNERSSRRFFSNQTDNNYGGTVNYSLPFELFKNKQTLKAGYMVSYKTRSFGARVFQYKAAGSTIQPIASLPINDIFASENLNPNGFELDEITNPTDEYKASGLLNAGYLMLDNNFSEKWRLTWGVRVESYTQNLDAIDVSKSVIDKTDNFLDVLPSANLT